MTAFGGNLAPYPPVQNGKEKRGGLLLPGPYNKLANLGAVRLKHVETTDIANALALAANTWVTILPAKSFTVALGTSYVRFDVGGVIAVGLAAADTPIASRLLINGATPYDLGGNPTVTAGKLGNALAGSPAVVENGFGATTHTVAVQVIAGAAAQAFCRCLTFGTYERLRLTVTEMPV